MTDPRARRLGIGLRGPLYWDPTEPHLLFVGGTGSGKSTFILSFIAGLGCDEWHWRYALVDVKRTTFGPYANGRNVIGCAITAVEADAVLANVYQEMMQRFKVLEAAKVQHWSEVPSSASAPPLYPIFLVIDELAAMLLPSPEEDAKAARARSDRQRAIVTSIGMLGRSCGIHLACGLQRPDASVISGSLRDQLGIRVALGRLLEDGRVMVFGSAGREVEMPGAVGRGLVEGASGSNGAVELINIPRAPENAIRAAFGM